MEGQRLANGRHPEARPGDYWKEPMGAFDTSGDRGIHWHWHCIAPDNMHHTLGQHRIDEHSDGTITVDPFVHDLRPVEHIGWALEAGNWRDLGGSEDSIVPNMAPAPIRGVR